MQHVDDHHLFDEPRYQRQTSRAYRAGQQRRAEPGHDAAARGARSGAGGGAGEQGAAGAGGITSAVSRLKNYVGDLLSGGRGSVGAGGLRAGNDAGARKVRRVSVGGSPAEGGADAEADGCERGEAVLARSVHSFGAPAMREDTGAGGGELGDGGEGGEISGHDGDEDATGEEEEEDELEEQVDRVFPNWLVEHAVSSRSTCRSCAGKIQEGEVRVGLQGFNAWGYVVRWYHLGHVSFPRSIAGMAHRIRGFTTLRKWGKDLVRQAVGGPAPAGTRGAEGAAARTPGIRDTLQQRLAQMSQTFRTASNEYMRQLMMNPEGMLPGLDRMLPPSPRSSAFSAQRYLSSGLVLQFVGHRSIGRRG